MTIDVLLGTKKLVDREVTETTEVREAKEIKKIEGHDPDPNKNKMIEQEITMQMMNSRMVARTIKEARQAIITRKKTTIFVQQ